jgi:hypothetical protein
MGRQKGFKILFLLCYICISPRAGLHKRLRFFTDYVQKDMRYITQYTEYTLCIFMVVRIRLKIERRKKNRVQDTVFFMDSTGFAFPPKF